MEYSTYCRSEDTIGHNGISNLNTGVKETSRRLLYTGVTVFGSGYTPLFQRPSSFLAKSTRWRGVDLRLSRLSSIWGTSS